MEPLIAEQNDWGTYAGTALTEQLDRRRELLLIPRANGMSAGWCFTWQSRYAGASPAFESAWRRLGSA